jgi:hypothetical protein
MNTGAEPLYVAKRACMPSTALSMVKLMSVSMFGVESLDSCGSGNGGAWRPCGASGWPHAGGKSACCVTGRDRVAMLLKAEAWHAQAEEDGHGGHNGRAKETGGTPILR